MSASTQSIAQFLELSKEHRVETMNPWFNRLLFVFKGIRMNREKNPPFVQIFLKMNGMILMTVIMTACSVGGSSQATETTESSIVSEALTPLPSPTPM